jgi:hypothetical protein
MTEYQVTLLDVSVTVAEFLEWLKTCQGKIETCQFLKEQTGEYLHVVCPPKFCVWCYDIDVIYLRFLGIVKF